MPLFLLIILDILGHCAIAQTDVASHIVAEVPIESDGDALTLRLDADGQSLLTLFDFGSPNLMLDSKSVKYRSAGEPKLLTRGANGEELILESVHSPKILKLGKASLGGDPFSVAVNLNQKRFGYGRPIQAIIGLGEFRDYVIEFDWDANQMRLRDIVPVDLQEWVQFTRSPKQPFPVITGTVSASENGGINPGVVQPATELDRLRAQFESAEETLLIRFQLHSALIAANEVFLSPEDAQSLRKSQALRDSDLQGNPIPVINNERNWHVLSNLTIGNCRSERLLVNSAPQGEPNRLSITWMLRHHIAFDMKNRRLYLAPRKKALPPLRNPELSGLVVSGDDRFVDETAIKVVSIKPNSAGDLAGIQVRDQIVKFNGRDLGQFRPYEVWLAQRIPATQHTLRIRRGDIEFDVTLRVPALSNPPSNASR